MPASIARWARPTREGHRPGAAAVAAPGRLAAGAPPGAAADLREGLEKTLTARQLGLSGALYCTLRTTNPIQNLNGLVAQYTCNVKRWKDGAMTLRWIASALVDVSSRFRKLRGFASMKALLKAVQQRAPADLDDTERKAA